jgi:hypothetical protein
MSAKEKQPAIEVLSNFNIKNMEWLMSDAVDDIYNLGGE